VSRDWRLFLCDILEYAGYVAEFTAGMSFGEFSADLKTQNAVLRCLEVIGEAVKRVPADALEAHPDVPWRRIARFRDRLAHAYFGVDLEIVWDVVEVRLPEVVSAVTTILAQAPESAGDGDQP
jgi:uncharacterized protein with HEPN domain